MRLMALLPPSSDLLQPDLLEDVIVSVCLKQHGLEPALQLLGRSDSARASSDGSGGTEEAGRDMEEHCSLLDAVFTRINGLERRLQVLYTHTHTRTIVLLFSIS